MTVWCISAILSHAIVWIRIRYHIILFLFTFSVNGCALPSKQKYVFARIECHKAVKPVWFYLQRSLLVDTIFSWFWVHIEHLVSTSQREQKSDKVFQPDRTIQHRWAVSGDYAILSHFFLAFELEVKDQNWSVYKVKSVHYKTNYEGVFKAIRDICLMFVNTTRMAWKSLSRV